MIKQIFYCMRGGDNMISAKEAKEQSDKMLQADVDEEMTEVENQIKQAISVGELSVYIDTCISKPAKKLLERLGYKVERGIQYNDFYTFIDWS